MTMTMAGVPQPSSPQRLDSMTFRKQTHGIRVTVHPVYLDEHSDPRRQRFVWAYHVQIENRSRNTMRLVSRYWSITDANGQVHEVRGPGVVGEQPVLAPGESFEYTSGTPLPTNSGFMLGAYQMVNLQGEQFEIEIPGFPLDIPDKPRALN